MNKYIITIIVALTALGIGAKAQTVYSCQYKSEADIVIYFTDYKSEAGWRNNSKKHLMY